MPIIQQVKVDNETVSGLFEKIPTEGDLHRFSAAETGKGEFIGMSDTSGKITTGTGYCDVTLGFRYLMGVKQLQIARVTNPGVGEMVLIPRGNEVQEANNRSGSNLPSSFDLSTGTFVYFEEIATDVVRIHRAIASDIFLFFVPHTATPASHSNRVIVLNQGDNVAIEMLGEGDGIMLRSPSGRRGLLRLGDNLNIRVQPK